MKKRFLAIVAAILAAFMLTGCDELDSLLNSSSSGDSTSSSKSESVKSSENSSSSESADTYKVAVHIDFVENLIFSTYDVNFSVDGVEKGTMKHGEDADFELSIKTGNHTITFENSESLSVKGEMTLNVDSDMEVEYQIACYNDKVTVKEIFVDKLVELPAGQVKADSSAYDYKSKNYAEVESSFKTLGFTNIKFDIMYDIVFGITQDGSVEKVTIDGNSDFKRGDVFSSDAEVVIAYHMPQDEKPEEVVSLSYSTNDLETAKHGNTGVFSYKSTGGSYDVYWLIDFDEGYVYWFMDGNGDPYCDKIKISGDLNNIVTVTWNDNGSIWSWYLRFKYTNNPETLVVRDQNGFDTEFVPTDLEKALGIRDTKTITDYSNTSVASSSESESSSTVDRNTLSSTSSSHSSAVSTGGNSGNTVTVPDKAETVGNLVWVPTNGGKKYHLKSGCSNMIDPIQVSIETAIANGYTACKRCH